MSKLLRSIRTRRNPQSQSAESALASPWRHPREVDPYRWRGHCRAYTAARKDYGMPPEEAFAYADRHALEFAI